MSSIRNSEGDAINNQADTLPGDQLDLSKMPGHWLLARMGKRVLRPGGLEMTRRMLDALHITSADRVVELAPGLGATARITLAQRPASYTAVERDPHAAKMVLRLLGGPEQQCVLGNANDTGLPDASADVVYGEAMLTMQVASQKKAIVAEASRVLRKGGRYAIHELGLAPDDIEDSLKAAILKDVSDAIHVGARPLTISEWCEILDNAGLVIDPQSCTTAPMHLLEPRRVLADEGLAGTLRIVWNVLRTPAARQRILRMCRIFRRYANHLCAITVVARKV